MHNIQPYLDDSKYKNVSTKLERQTTDRIASVVEIPVTKNPTVNKPIADYVHGKMQEFSESTKSLDTKGVPFSQHISYQVGYNDQSNVSLVVEGLQDDHTSATPRHFTKMWVFDLNQGQEITTKDLFGGSYSAAMPVLATLIGNDVRQRPSVNQSIDETLLMQAMSQSELMSFSTNDKKTITFVFEQGSVAAKTAGEITVNLSVDQLVPYLTTDVAKRLFDTSEQSLFAPPKDITAQTAPRVDCRIAKCIAFTFDDGPSRYTNQLLDTLKSHHAYASFFLIGKNVERSPLIVKRQVQEGNVVGNHSWSHASLVRLDENHILDQINRDSDIIKKVSGTTPHYLRPPYGAVNQTVYDAAAKLSLPLVLWSIDTRDWADKNPDLIYNRVIAKAKPGAIVVMHDTYQTSVDAMPRILDTLTKQGYTFATLDDLLASGLKTDEPYYSAPST